MQVWLTRTFLLTALCSAVFVVSPPPARAQKEDARKHYDRATAAFGLGRYADAAVEYEAAFRMRPDPALLYNCAQSYRLAGNKPRAVELYRNYVRLYGDAPNAEDARSHLNNLELEVSAERAATSRSSTHPAPVPTTAIPSPAPAPSHPPAPTPAPTFAIKDPAAAAPPAPPPNVVGVPAADIHVDVVATPQSVGPSDREQRPLLRRPWFWAAVGAVVVGGTIAILVAASGDKDPKPTFGVIAGN